MKAHEVKGYEPMSEEEMKEVFGVDEEVWESDRLKHNARPTSMRRKDGEVVQIMNYQTTLFLKRKHPEIYDTLVEVMEQRLKTMPPRFKKEHYQQTKGVLGQVLLADAHIDQRDTRKTPFRRRSKRLIEANRELLTKIDMFGPEQLLFVNMGDYFNSSYNYKTARGTEQQNIMSEKDAWKFGIDLQAELLLQMSKYGPVFAKFIGGNHEEHSNAHLQEVMRYYFQNNPNIKIDTDDGVYQFYEWGKTMFGYDHGHEARPKQFAEVLVREKGRKHEFVEGYRGHLHHKKVEEIVGVLIHNVANSGLQSEREASKGYKHAPSMTGLVHDKKKGKIAEITEPVI